MLQRPWRCTRNWKTVYPWSGKALCNSRAQSMYFQDGFFIKSARYICELLESNKVWMNISADIISAQKQVDVGEKSRREIPKPWQFQQRGVSNRDWQIGDWKSLYAIVFVAPSSGGVSFVIKSLLFCSMRKLLNYIPCPVDSYTAVPFFRRNRRPISWQSPKKKDGARTRKHNSGASRVESFITLTHWDDDEPFRL